MVSGEGRGAVRSTTWLQRRFNGAPDWYPGKDFDQPRVSTVAAMFQWSPRLVSGEGGAPRSIKPEAALFQWSPRLVSGEGSVLDTAKELTGGGFQWSPRLVSGEGFKHFRQPHPLVNEFQWSPRLVSGEGPLKLRKEQSTCCGFNGAPDWYPGKETGTCSGRSAATNVSMEPQIGIRGREIREPRVRGNNY